MPHQQNQELPGKSLKQKFEDCMAAGEYIQAERLVRSELHKNTENSDFFLMIGQAQLRRHRYKEVIANARFALDLDVKSHQALFLRARAYIQQVELLKANESIETAIKLEPQNFDYVILAAQIRLLAGKAHKAMPYLEQASSHYAHNPELTLLHISAHFICGRQVEAQKLFDVIFEQDTVETDNHVLHAWNHMLEGNYRRALNLFRLAYLNDNLDLNAVIGHQEAAINVNVLARMFNSLLRHFVYTTPGKLFAVFTAGSLAMWGVIQFMQNVGYGGYGYIVLIVVLILLLLQIFGNTLKDFPLLVNHYSRKFLGANRRRAFAVMLLLPFLGVCTTLFGILTDFLPRLTLPLLGVSLFTTIIPCNIFLTTLKRQTTLISLAVIALIIILPQLLYSVLAYSDSVHWYMLAMALPLMLNIFLAETLD